LDVEDLVRQGRIERIEADRSAARDRMRDAARHLASAEAIADADPAGAYALVYDAARKAIDAHMLASGYRASKGRIGAHEATARYASMVLESGTRGEHVRHFDRMRRNRNRLEYGVWRVGHSTLEADLRHARGIIAAVRDRLK
jgi:hypothetical protein